MHWYPAALPALRSALVPGARAEPEPARGAAEPLTGGWMLRSSCEANATGQQISSDGFSTDGWHKTNVPSTVVAALVADGTYPDPYYSDNLRKIPGETYPIGKNFSRMAIPKESPFHCSWWYRTTFEAKHSGDEHVWLHFGGINNHANIWVNGKQVANEKDVAGAYRTYDFDVTQYVTRGQQNALAVETIAQSDKDLGINWVDWNPAPPDKDMGLWRGVSVQVTGPVTVAHPFVTTHFPDAVTGTSGLDSRDRTEECQREAGDRHARNVARRFSSHAKGDAATGRASRGSIHAGTIFPASTSAIRKFGGRGKWARRDCGHSQCGSRSAKRFPIQPALITGSAKSRRNSTRKTIACFW